MASCSAMCAFIEVCPTRLTTRRPPRLATTLGHRPGGDLVDDDGAAGLAGQFLLRDHRGDHRRLHHLAALVDDEAPIGVPVEHQADVGAVVADRLLGGHEVLGDQRVGHVVGEPPVQLQVEPDDVEPERPQHRARREPGHAVPGVHDDLQRSQPVQIDQRAQVFPVAGQEVDLAALPPGVGAGAGTEPMAVRRSATSDSGLTGAASGRQNLMPL
jgi:hypothetical protein